MKLVSLLKTAGTLALTTALIDALAQRLPLAVHIVTLSDLARGLGASLSRSELPVAVERELRHIETADALLVAAPVYRGGLPGHFKHLFDLIDADSLVDKPVLLAATGGSPRHALVIDHQLRPLFGFLQALSLPIGVYASSEDFVNYQVDDAALRERITLAADRAAAVLGRLEPVRRPAVRAA